MYQEHSAQPSDVVGSKAAQEVTQLQIDTLVADLLHVCSECAGWRNI
jgi:hypothetical protein